MADAMGGARACVLRGHGLVTVGASVAEAVLVALDVVTLARVRLRVAAAGGSPAPIPAEDLAELPDLGRAFNVEALWRHHTATLGPAADTRRAG
jgi:ribulose-5-phosphate 4-epimerase/fuculose-1-phosphate aldolase